MRFNPAFKGVTGKDSRGFAIFRTYYHGLRAMRILIQNYIKKGTNTINLIVNKYAPAADQNQPDKYAAFVSSQTGIARDKILKPEEAELLIPAMVKMETGKEVTNWEISLSKNMDSLGSWIPFYALAALLFFGILKK